MSNEIVIDLEFIFIKIAQITMTLHVYIIKLFNLLTCSTEGNCDFSSNITIIFGLSFMIFLAAILNFAGIFLL